LQAQLIGEEPGFGLCRQLLTLKSQIVKFYTPARGICQLFQCKNNRNQKNVRLKIRQKITFNLSLPIKLLIRIRRQSQRLAFHEFLPGVILANRKLANHLSICYFARDGQITIGIKGRPVRSHRAGAAGCRRDPVQQGHEPVSRHL
jgi:hypothetical protein